jgi:hypothetical protein
MRRTRFASAEWHSAVRMKAVGRIARRYRARQCWILELQCPYCGASARALMNVRIVLFCDGLRRFKGGRA